MKIPSARTRFAAEAALAGALGLVARELDDPWRWVAAVPALVVATLLLRTGDGFRFVSVVAVACLLGGAAIFAEDGAVWPSLGLAALAVGVLAAALVWIRIPKIRRLPVEAVPAAALGAVVLFVEDQRRWFAAIPAIVLALFLARTDAGIRLLAAIGASAFFVAAVFWEDGGGWRLALVGAGLAAIWAARWIGAIVWPDVAVILLACLAVVAVRDVRKEQVAPFQPPPAVALFDLPGELIRPLATELTAPARVEVVALTPVRPTIGAIAHEATRFEGLLLTTVPLEGVTGPVRLVVERGEDSEEAAEVVRASEDADHFVLLPQEDCFVAPSQTNLTEPEAQTILEGHGFPSGRAKGYAESFRGPIDFVSVEPERRFKRYFSGRAAMGWFLTEEEFDTATAAQRGLKLPSSNKGDTQQSVRATAPTMTLRGRIEGGDLDAEQWVVLRLACFEYGEGKPVDEE